MRRGQFAYAAGVQEKWVHNAEAALGRRLPYTAAVACQLSVARAIQAALPVPLPAAYHLAADALRTASTTSAPTIARSPDGAVAVTIDLPHVLSAFSVRLAHAMQQEPRRPGRRPQAARRPGSDARSRAAAYGVDLSLLQGNLRRTADERLRALDSNAAFVSALRRRAAGR
jgi:hypothetical protein